MSDKDRGGEVPSSTAPADEAHERRRFVRRTIVGLLIAGALAVCWIVMQRQKLARQDRWTAELQALGAEPLYDDAFDAEGNELPGAQRRPNGMQLMFGADPLRRVVGVRFTPRFDRRALTRLTSFDQLRFVSLRACTLSKDDLFLLAGAAPALRKLDLRGARVEPVQLAPLKDCKQLLTVLVDEPLGERLRTEATAVLPARCRIETAPPPRE